MKLHIERARAAMDLERWDLAQENLGRALAEEPNSAVLHVLQAEVHYRKRQYLEATDSAREAISLAPQWSVGYYWLTYCLLANCTASGDVERLAGDAADTAIACDPEDPDNYAARAEVARVAGRSKQSIDFAREGLSIDPEHRNCLRLVALGEIGLKRPEAAEITLRRMLSLDPESNFAHEHLSSTLLMQGRSAEAYEHVKALIRRDPDDEDVRLIYGEVVRHQHPVARWLLRSGDFWFDWIYAFVPLGFVPLLSIKWLQLDEPWKTLFTILAVLWLLLCCAYSVVAAGVAEAIITFSTRFNRLLPETRGMRWLYALAAGGAVIAFAALVFGAAIGSSQPILIGGNILVAGAIAVAASLSRTGREMRLQLLALLVPIAVQTIALLWQPDARRAGGAAMLVLAAWALAIAFPLMISNREQH